MSEIGPKPKPPSGPRPTGPAGPGPTKASHALPPTAPGPSDAALRPPGDPGTLPDPGEREDRSTRQHMSAWRRGEYTHRGEAEEELLADLAAEVKRQDQFHPSGYPATRDGVFLGIKTAAHELNVEAVDAWRADRCRCETPLCGHADWQATRGEMLQAAAVIIRTIRSIDQHGVGLAAVHERGVGAT